MILAFLTFLISLIKALDDSKTIPISVPIEAMIVKGDYGCNHIECPKEVLPQGPCGTRCWYNPKSKKIKPTFEYEFKGERFQVYGTWDKNHGTMAVYINDTLIKIIDQSQHERTLYALQYTSDILPYGNHRIKIAANEGDSELYKLTYWPSVKAIRMNSTEMQPPWGKDSDGIGGLIEWNNGNHYKFKTAKIRCSKIWLYGTMAKNHNILKLRIGDQVHKINLHKEGPKINSTLVFESENMPLDDYLLTFEHDGGIQFSCIFYLTSPPPSSKTEPSQTTKTEPSQAIKTESSQTTKTEPQATSQLHLTTEQQKTIQKKTSFIHSVYPNYSIRSGAKTEELINLKKCTLMNENSISPLKLKDNIKLSQDGQIISINIGQTSIRFNSIKESYYLGLNEAFSSTSNETEFILVSDLFQKIVESNIDDIYSDIAQEILKSLKENSESLLSNKKNSDVENELFNMLSILCPSSGEDDIKTVIKQYGGMVNYIIPLMSEINCLSPQKRMIEIKQPFIAAGLLLLYNEATQTELIRTTPFSVWKQSKNGTIELTRIARKRISSSNHPCLVMLFGSLRTGKSTLASHLVSGPQANHSKTLFKSAGTAKSCTYLINAVGPIKCKNLASSFDIIQDDFRNLNWNRDIFIIDSEGLNSINYETSWLKQALLAMLPVNTITIYVAKSTNKADLDQFMKYLRLVRVIGGIKIHHGLGYIDNQEKFDGSNIMDQLLEQNIYTTNEIISEFDKTSVNIDDSHFKCLSVLSFDRHINEYYKSLGEVARFITNLCLHEGAVMTGDMIIDMLEEFADKTNDIGDLNETDKMFEVIFFRVLENAMKKSINEQTLKIQNEIRQKLILMPIQELNLLDIDAFITKIEEGGLVTKVINEAVSKTLPDIPESFPVIINSSRTDIINLIKNTVRQERLKLISKQALEVPDLGGGFSVIDGTFKKKVFNLNFSQNLTEVKLSDDVFVAYHLPEFTETKLVPLKYQQYKTNSHSSLDDYMSHFASHFSDSSSFGFVSEKLSFDKSRKVATNLMGITFSTNRPEQNVSIAITVNSAAQVRFDNDADLKQHLAPNLRKLFNDLNDTLQNKDIKSDEVKSIASEIFDNYGESVATGFFIGNYEIDISHSDKLSIESSGQAAFSSSKSGSGGIGGFGIKFGKSSSSQESKETKFNSQVHESSQEHTIVSYGSVEQPATFMFDIAEGSSFGSSFVPIWKYSPSKKVEDALKYWAGRWNMKPETLSEYMYLNDLEDVPKDKKITLYHKNKAYQVFINNKSEIIIPDSEIKYSYSVSEDGRGSSSTTIFGVILDPSKMTIGGFSLNTFVKRWKRRTGHHSRAFGYESRILDVKLGPFFEFDQEIIPAYFKGDGMNYMILNSIDSHSFTIRFRDLEEAGGKSWTRGPYCVQLQTKLKVKLA